jgi:hypothetical protein
VTERGRHALGATSDVSALIENYDETIPLVEEITHGIPDGLIAHIASPTETGYRITEVWQSEDHWKRFWTDVLTPLLQRLYLAGLTRTT